MGRPGDEDDSAFEESFGSDPIRLEIEESIDLHRFHPSEIVAIVDAYLAAALDLGFREVRLIHGRGRGVQRARIRALLERDVRVVAFTDAPSGRGGWGATIAWLQKPDQD